MNANLTGCKHSHYSQDLNPTNNKINKNKKKAAEKAAQRKESVLTSSNTPQFFQTKLDEELSDIHLDFRKLRRLKEEAELKTQTLTFQWVALHDDVTTYAPPPEVSANPHESNYYNLIAKYRKNNTYSIKEYSNGDYYRGGLNQQELRSGNGAFITKNYIVECHWYKDKPEGRIKITYLNGDIFLGNTCKNQGSAIIAEGSLRSFNKNKIKYEGKLCNYQIAGDGIRYYDDGSEVSGIWDGDGNKCTMATYVHPDGTSYLGPWHDNQPQTGNCKFAKGGKYYGQLKNNINHQGKSGLVAHGKGSLTYDNKVEYNGDFYEDFFKGFGQLTYPQYGDFKGEWNNRYLFNGIFTPYNNNELSITCENLFVPPPYFNLDELAYYVEYLPQNANPLPSCLQGAYSCFYKDLFYQIRYQDLLSKVKNQANSMVHLKKLFAHIINYPQAKVPSDLHKRIKNFHKAG